MTTKDVEGTTYAPDPALTINSKGEDRFTTFQIFDIVRLVDLEYTLEQDGY